MNALCNRRRKTGAILVLTAVMMVCMFAFLAFAVDMGYIALTRTQLQSAADSAAMAGAGELLHNRVVTPAVTVATAQSQAQTSARYYAANNFVAGNASSTLADSDITFGRISLTGSLDSPLVTSGDATKFNAARIHIRRSAAQNGEVPLFFVRVLGINTVECDAVATAAYADNFKGFKPPSEGQPNLPIMPFALDEQTWNQLLAGNAADNWTWHEDTRRVTPGPDGVREANLFPQGTGSPGNRGTVDIGDSNNSTADLSRQISEGVTAHDLSHLPDGKLELGSDGTLELNGDTGISAGVKDELQGVINDAIDPATPNTRIIPIFRSVSGNGNNAQYTIVKFVGVRLMAVKLTGNMSGKYVIIQPAVVMIENGIPGSDDTEGSQNLFSKHVWLVR